MTYALIFLALIMAVVVGYLLSQTINRQPWLASDPLENRPAGAPQSLDPRKIGLGVFLAVVTSLFGLFFSAYAMRMSLPDWVRVPEPGLLWVNTLSLVLASVAMQAAVGASRTGNLSRTRRSLVTAGVLTMAFLAGQLAVWQGLQAAGFFMYSNPASAFFYLLTALHGLHLLGGLWVWGRVLHALAGSDTVGECSPSIELCALYWHFLLLVWLFLFALLIAT